jgi:hypothetical protein
MSDFIAAMEQDLTVTEYPTFDDLKGIPGVRHPSWAL